jgi:molybdopterin-guanine dinucleotide biosynthesis protein A
MMNNQSIDCLGVVLAGGLSSRMGKDKAQLSRQNDTVKSASSMLDFSKQLLTDAGINKVVVSGDNYQIPDLISQAGPVGGIYSVLAHYPEHLQPKAFLILPVDLPLMTPAALMQLRMKGELTNKATFFQDSQKRTHHIPLYLPNNAFLQLFIKQAFQGSQLLTDAKKSSKNGPSVRAMLQQVPHQVINSSNNNLLFNTNTPQEWQQAQQQF